MKKFKERNGSFKPKISKKGPKVKSRYMSPQNRLRKTRQQNDLLDKGKKLKRKRSFSPNHQYGYLSLTTSQRRKIQKKNR